MFYNGLITAAYTPFKKDLSLDLKKIPVLVEYYKSQPLAGIFVCGSTGECSSMTDDERLLTAEYFIKEAKNKIPLIVHVGSSSVESSKMFAKHAQEKGADAIAAVAPYYFKPNSPEQLIDCLSDIAKAAPKLPFYFYHIPALTGVCFPMANLIEQFIKKIPNFAGIKYTYENLMDFQLSLDACKNRVQMLFGRDEILLAGLVLGAKGGIGSTYNYAAKLYNSIIENYNNNNLKEAWKLQLLSQKMINIPGAGKKIMKFAGIDVGPNRKPIQSMTEQEEEILLEELKKINFIEWIK